MWSLPPPFVHMVRGQRFSLRTPKAHLKKTVREGRVGSAWQKVSKEAWTKLGMGEKELKELKVPSLPSGARRNQGTREPAAWGEAAAARRADRLRKTPPRRGRRNEKKK